MFNFLVKDFYKNLNTIDFKESCLWVINSNKTPPHIGVSSENLFFSLKANGKDFELSAQQVFQKLIEKNVELIMFQLKEKITSSVLSSIYSNYSCAIPSKISCLTPILEVLAINERILLPQLLSYLEDQNLISSIFVFNSDRELIKIGNYTEFDVAKEIEKFQHAKRK
jgi:hypothetical protein